ncbi:hypothetical protein ARMGADRAFT_1093374 [Armillaria gallica]|uniref:Uncharacterized protein n=1 Tax=Armillaria gallica TaxID=47427 RepID=A0A2H3CV61_ARMGA|nr:hypothetical protein ARMGADRAFT_1093374 [Armillaria gallica]
MSLAALPSRGQCIEITDNLQLCQCLSFASTLDQTPRVQACTCSASLIEHMPVMNVHRVPATPPNVDNALPSNANTFTGDATNIPFTQVPMPAPSTNDVPSYSYGDVMIFTSTLQPVIRPSLISTLIPTPEWRISRRSVPGQR